MTCCQAGFRLASRSLAVAEGDFPGGLQVGLRLVHSGYVTLVHQSLVGGVAFGMLYRPSYE